MSQFSSSNFPQTAPLFTGNAGINGFQAGPKDQIMTLGGFLDQNDSNNNSVSTLAFGTVVSSLAGSGAQWAVGKPSGSYFYRGIAMCDAGILENEPFKSGGYLKGSPATAMTLGFMRFTTWTTTHTSALATPVLGCLVVCKNSNGVIEFVPSGTTPDSGWTDISAYVKLVSYEKPVGALLKVQFN